MNDAIETWTPRVGSTKACRAFGLSPRTYRYRRQGAEGRLPERPSRATPRETHKQLPWKIPDPERDQIRAVLCSDRFADLAPAQVYATLLDEGSYLCSERTMYRLLHEDDLVAERRRGHRRSPHEKPRVQATGPNQAWSWDISRLRGPSHRSWFYRHCCISDTHRCRATEKSSRGPALRPRTVRLTPFHAESVSPSNAEGEAARHNTTVPSDGRRPPTQ